MVKVSSQKNLFLSFCLMPWKCYKSYFTYKLYSKLHLVWSIPTNAKEKYIADTVFTHCAHCFQTLRTIFRHFAQFSHSYRLIILLQNELIEIRFILNLHGFNENKIRYKTKSRDPGTGHQKTSSF